MEEKKIKGERRSRCFTLCAKKKRDVLGFQMFYFKKRHFLPISQGWRKLGHVRKLFRISAIKFFRQLIIAIDCTKKMESIFSYVFILCTQKKMLLNRIS